jgi:class 3 adenylate cyclase
VTVLFADVAGFTPLATALDPEESYTLMRRCFDLMLAEVHHYEGTVTQFLGDGILALFGAPIAHEDHAERAVRAALGIQHALRTYRQELQESRGIPFRMRIGLNSGLVVVGGIGTDLNMTYTAIGDTVNLGDRIRSLAEPDTVVISETTYRLVSGYFVTQGGGHPQVPGASSRAARARRSCTAGAQRKGARLRVQTRGVSRRHPGGTGRSGRRDETLHTGNREEHRSRYRHPWTLSGS